MTATYPDVASQIFAVGYARVQLSAADLAALADVRSAAAGFFARDTRWKLSHGDRDGLHGYRPYGMQDSGDISEPDECESFAYWADRPGLIPGQDQISAFIAALAGWWDVAAAVTGGILADLAGQHRYSHEWDFGPSSYIEINNYGAPSGRELLQGRHEDGHLISLVVPDKPGLEIEQDGAMRPAAAGPGEMFVMPGSLLTAMTGDDANAIQPLYHQVRNHYLAQRLTVLFFVNTPFTGTVPPYVTTNRNRGTDMAALALSKCTLFGKALPEVLG
jgi:isopenicillin N synthase-like dioxygenase